jgi:hypothetical protein
MTHCHRNFTKKILFSWETFTYGNISVALVIKYPCIYETSFSMLWTQLHSRFLVNFPLRSKFSWPFLTVQRTKIFLSFLITVGFSIILNDPVIGTFVVITAELQYALSFYNFKVYYFQHTFHPATKNRMIFEGQTIIW